MVDKLAMFEHAQKSLSEIINCSLEDANKNEKYMEELALAIGHLHRSKKEWEKKGAKGK